MNYGDFVNLSNSVGVRANDRGILINTAAIFGEAAKLNFIRLNVCMALNLIIYLIL
jgi:hypothetical protein